MLEIYNITVFPVWTWAENPRLRISKSLTASQNKNLGH